MLAEHIHLLALVAGRYQLLEPQELEVQFEVAVEIADGRVVAIAINHLAAEVLPVMLEFIFNIGKLRVELVFFVGFRFVQVAILCHALPRNPMFRRHLVEVYPLFIAPATPPPAPPRRIGEGS